MYCKNCQKYGKKGDVYCSECGEKLTLNLMPMKVSKKTIALIVGFFLFWIIAFFIFQFTRQFYTPQYVAEKYFQAVAKNDIDKIYSYIDEGDSIFYSKALLEEKSEKINVDDYHMISVVADDSSAEVLFEYTDYNTVKRAYVLLKKEENSISLYPKWKVESAKVAQNVEFRILKGSSLKLDNKDLSSYLVKTEGNFDIYRIKTMAAGEYEVNATLSNGLSIQETMEVQSNETYILSTVNLEEAMSNQFGNQITTTLNRLYTSALTSKTYQNIHSYFKVSLEDLYDTIKTKMSNSNIQSIQFSDPSIKKAYINSEGNLETYVTLDYRTKEKIDNQVETFQHQASYQVEFEYQDGNFYIKNVRRG